ncbi:MAG: hypothetical protein ACKVH8_03135 [Pirellulales bacterium]|jgi:hypothetical protein
MRTIISGFVLLLVCLIVVPTWAQGYTVIPISAPNFDPDSTDSTVRGNVLKAKFKIQAALRDDAPLTTDDQQLMRNFFENAYFNSWTQVSSSNKAGTKRIEFLKTFYGPSLANPQARPGINILTLAKMTEFIKPEYHPVVRFNAMLLIGDLKSRENPIGSSSVSEVPLAASLSVIVNALKDKSQSDPVKVAALLGLRKHCELVSNRPPNQIAAILDIVKEYIATDEPPAGRAADAHLWMRRQAIDIVGVLGSGGKNGEFAGLLDKVITDDKLPLKIRCSAIVTKGKLNFNQVDLLKEYTNIGKVALEAVKADVEWFDTAMTKYEEDKLGPNSGYGECGGYGGGYGECGGYGAGCGGYDCGECGECGGYGDPRNPMAVVKPVDPILNQIQLTFRRRMKYHLDSAKQGLVGNIAEAPSDPRTLRTGLMRYAKTANEANAAKSLVDPMIALLNEVDQQEVDEKELLSSVQIKVEDLTRAVQKLAAGPKGATPPPVAKPGVNLPGRGPANLPGGAGPKLPGAAGPKLPGGAAGPALPGGAGPKLPGGAPAP